MGTREKIGKSSSAAASWRSMMSTEPRCAYELYASIPAPITSSPLSAWLTYTWTAFDMITLSSTGSISSDTSACSGWLWIGRRIRNMSARTVVVAGATRPTRRAAIGPRDVRTPAIRPPSTSKPVTSQSWMMSTPSRSAARA